MKPIASPANQALADALHQALHWLEVMFAPKVFLFEYLTKMVL